MCNSMYVGANICVFYWHKVQVCIFKLLYEEANEHSISHCKGPLPNVWLMCHTCHNSNDMACVMTWLYSKKKKKPFTLYVTYLVKKINYNTSMLESSLDKLDFECGSLRYVLRISSKTTNWTSLWRKKKYK